jgi:hypothetical protein
MMLKRREKLMTILEAVNILKPIGNTLEDLKKAFKVFAMTYHPDINPNGLEMMKLGNIAKELLEKTIGLWEPEKISETSTMSIDQELNDMINKVKRFHGIELELRGVYLWVYGNTYPYRKELNEYGFKWARVKKEWFYAANGRKPKTRREMSVEEQREKFGFQKIIVQSYVLA